MPQLTANGLTFHVQYLGQPTAPPVVMIHGMLTGNVASWYFGLAPVLAHEHRVFLYDQRGHGRSERPIKGYTLTELASDLAQLTLSLGPCALVGHSYGGVVALRHAIEHPDRVTAVVLVDSFVPGGARGIGVSGDGAGDDGSGGIDLAAISAWGKERRSRGAGTNGTGRRRRGATAEQILLGGTTVLSDLRRDSVLDPEGLAALPMPLYCAVGSDSPFRGDVEALVDLLPPHRQVQVISGGHALHLDAPEDLATAVQTFLAGHAPEWSSSDMTSGRDKLEQDQPMIGATDG